ncbi:hypothetical protein Ddc_19579 [Ditylenchus destructor]|nr:hypothetical protein Ddc_19579 [Ditylenchus destructor]
MMKRRPEAKNATARADGRKLSPFILLPRKKPDPKIVEKFKNKLVLCWAGETWMNDNLVGEYLDKVIGPSLFRDKRLLVWDALSCHKSEATKAKLRALRIDEAIVPGGCTPFVQFAISNMSQGSPMVERSSSIGCGSKYQGHSRLKQILPAGNLNSALVDEPRRPIGALPKRHRIILCSDSDSEPDSVHEKGSHIEKEAPKVNEKSPNSNVDGAGYSLRPRSASKNYSLENYYKPFFLQRSDSEPDSGHENGGGHIEKEAPKVNGKSPNSNVDGAGYSLRPRSASKNYSLENYYKPFFSQRSAKKPREVDLDLDDEYEFEGRTPAKRRGVAPTKSPSSARKAKDVNLDLNDKYEIDGPSHAKCRGRSPEKSPSRATSKSKNMANPIEIIVVKKLEQPTLLSSNNHYTVIILSEKRHDYDVLQALRQRMEIVSNDGVYYARNSFEANWVSIEAVLRSFGFVEDEFAFNNEFSASKKDSWKFVRSV